MKYSVICQFFQLVQKLVVTLKSLTLHLNSAYVVAIDSFFFFEIQSIWGQIFSCAIFFWGGGVGTELKRKKNFIRTFAVVEFTRSLLGLEVSTHFFFFLSCV